MNESTRPVVEQPTSTSTGGSVDTSPAAVLEKIDKFHQFISFAAHRRADKVLFFKVQSQIRELIEVFNTYENPDGMHLLEEMLRVLTVCNEQAEIKESMPYILDMYEHLWQGLHRSGGYGVGESVIEEMRNRSATEIRRLDEAGVDISSVSVEPPAAVNPDQPSNVSESTEANSKANDESEAIAASTESSPQPSETGLTTTTSEEDAAAIVAEAVEEPAPTAEPVEVADLEITEASSDNGKSGSDIETLAEASPSPVGNDSGAAAPSIAAEVLKLLQSAQSSLGDGSSHNAAQLALQAAVLLSKEDIQKRQSALEDLDQRRTQTEASVGSTNEAIAQSEAVIQKTENDLSDRKQKLEAATAVTAKTQQELTDGRDQMRRIEDEIRALELKKQEAARQVESIQTKVEQAKSDESKLESEITSLDSRIEDERRKKENARIRLEELSSGVSHVRKEMDEHRSEVDRQKMLSQKLAEAIQIG